MSSLSGLRFLRPYLLSDVAVTRKAAYVRFFYSTQGLSAAKKSKLEIKRDTSPELMRTGIEHKSDVQARIAELQNIKALDWPRIENDETVMQISKFREKYQDLKPSKYLTDHVVTLRGRITSFRVAGRHLAFIDISQDGVVAQIVCVEDQLKLTGLPELTGIPVASFKDFFRMIRRGDIISTTGYPERTISGELSIHSDGLPTLITPILASLPKALTDRETRIRNRHVDLLVNDTVMNTLKLRSHMIQYLRQFLLKDEFLEVQTPLIADKAGGAIARPFTTVATEFSEKELALRIAPEIWLKRLVIGGMGRVFEIGPAFRNEGLDATHNPEFTTCEFYKSFTDLENLMTMTEDMICGMAEMVKKLKHESLSGLPELDQHLSVKPFNRLNFISTIESKIGETLPDLAAEDAQEKLKALFQQLSIPLPHSPTLPRLLDKLASIHIEPLCASPTFITHHPACMAPLSKSFLDHETNQIVSARAELFIQGREIANMYEEENSPIEQRKKFEQQLQWKDEENTATVDESYVEALEWGLPPTGGWGCGVDRLVMLFSGATRISDVLSFGSLRNVVNLSTPAGNPDAKKKVEEKA